MGQRASTGRRGSFTGVLPASQRTAKRSNTPSTSPRAESPATARPVEATIPVIHTPPHALDDRNSEAALLSSLRRTLDQHEAFAVPESVRKSRTLEQFEQTCSEILPTFMFVSNLQVAQDLDLLQRVGITHVLNCCKEVVCFAPTDTASITYLQLALRDGVQEDLLPFLPQVVEWIDDCRRKHGRVLVHCHQGVSRSCALAIAYVMYRDRCSFQTAMALVKARRAICSPNTAFICQLLEWERALAGRAGTTDDGLYRLAPHAPYDAATLVLKQCYHGESRRKVTLSTERMEWLWGHGIFVFIDSLEKKIVVWKGSQCTIVDGVDHAKAHAQRMLRVLGGDISAEEMAITVAEGSCDDVGVDHFGYASELAWTASMTDATAAPSAIVHDVTLEDGGLAREQSEEPVPDKPVLFQLEDEISKWEQLTNYDSNDLVASSVLLLVWSMHSAYLWIGGGRRESNVETLCAAAQCQLEKCSTAGNTLHVEHQDAESDSFWEVFEAGY